jgi:hypothetical protein
MIENFRTLNFQPVIIFHFIENQKMFENNCVKITYGLFYLWHPLLHGLGSIHEFRGGGGA